MALPSLLTRGLIMFPLCVAVICLVRKANEVASDIGATMAGAVDGGRYYDDADSSDEGEEDAGWVALPVHEERRRGGPAADGNTGGWRWWSWQAGGGSGAAEQDGDEGAAGEAAGGNVETSHRGGQQQDGLSGLCVACMAAPATVGFLHTHPPPPPGLRSRTAVAAAVVAAAAVVPDRC
ncbi:hypothetical protein HXX76_014487 [Chlamydomonas incerta]|uniref:Uncharacterized protein n=1 Tax=Chlamydomonas incerta TaxID=51695 RepID=A0A835SCH6_CHLIN|nr:hypothetical protein HXX76_014487 [Chlamydomonas incerta]|eukprot:KAG2424434.1 hypothetical protein HXX76_014487 [Chlamydomonas incerta]